ncbi:MAG TPA: hypothetical protein VF129_09600 [Actinomycetota bacterium]
MAVVERGADRGVRVLMDLNAFGIGRRRVAAKRLFAAIDGAPRSGVEALDTRLIIRGSTAPQG